MRKLFISLMLFISVLQTQTAQAQISNHYIDCATEAANLYAFASSKEVGISNANRVALASLKGRYKMLLNYGKLRSLSSKSRFASFKKKMATSLVAKANKTTKILNSPKKIKIFLARSSRKVNRCWAKYGPVINRYIRRYIKQK